MKGVVNMKKSSKTLVIDTATDYLYLAYMENEALKDDVHEPGKNDHSVKVVPQIKAILDKNNLALADINQVIIGVGPGSYTGVRIGVSIAKMIGYMNDVDVYKVSTLALMATASGAECIVPFIDARRGNAYMALYKQSGETLSAVKEDRIENTDAFFARITFLYDKVTDQKPNPAKLLSSDWLLTKVDDIHGLAPNYMQITEAERNLREKHAN